jgi:hypothetical protein
MNYQDDLFEQTRQKMRIISERLDDELSALQKQGLLMPVDKQKMIADAKTSGKAILNALERNDYPSDMQSELIKRLIVQFENSVDEVINQAKLRKYSRSSLMERFSAIEDDILRQFSNLSNKDIDRVRRDFSRLKSTFIDRIELLIKRGNVKDTSIEPIFEQYKGDATNIILRSLPKLGAAEEILDKESGISSSRPKSSDGKVKFQGSKEDFIKLDNKDVQKKTLLTKSPSSAIKIGLLILLIVICLLEFLLFQPLLFLFKILH